MNNRSFSLVIVPDSGTEVKIGLYTTRIIAGTLSVLVVLLFCACFFVADYHIKLSQENSYKNAVSNHKRLLKRINELQFAFSGQSERLMKIRNNDKILRLYAMMSHIDDDMYKGGIGGHAIIDDSEYSVFDDDFHNELVSLSYDIVGIDNRIDIQEKSLREINAQLRNNCEIIDNTPTIFPTYFNRITSPFGWRSNPVTGRREPHNGVDLRAPAGQPIRTTAEGTVSRARFHSKLGNSITIIHKYGYKTLYAHLDKMYVKAGDTVRKGDVIGTMGRTGRATGVHLHYGVYLNGKPRDPMNYIVVQPH